jgi:sugar lactone lactonase YvrE
MFAMNVSAMTLLSPVLAGSTYEVLHTFKDVEYVWGSEHERQQAVDSGAFVVENNAITGLKACNADVSSKCGDQTRLFATVPRWLPGVPATLAEVVSSADGKSLLQPWPDRASQDPDDCSKIQYVQSMEITPDGLMWIVDVGRKYFNDPDSVDNSCPPKMVLMDVESKKVVDSYVFPNKVAPHTGSFLNDIVVDVVEQVGYISSTGNNITDLGAIVMYDRLKKTSRRFEHPSTHAEGAFHVREFELQGVPTDGIALTPDRKHLYYCALTGLGLYSISTEAFRESSEAAKASLISHGEKPDISDGMAFGSDGSLFFGGLQTDALYRWHPESGVPVAEAEVLAQSKEELYWIDTLAFDNRGKLLVTSNKLAAFFNNAMDFSSENFRIISFDVGTNSYMQASADTLKTCEDYFGDVSGVVTVVDPTLGVPGKTDASGEYCDANNVSRPCSFIHFAGLKTECGNPAPPDSTHRYHKVTYSNECSRVLASMNLTGQVDVDHVFDSQGAEAVRRPCAQD